MSPGAAGVRPRKYRRRRGSTVTGRLLVLRDVESVELGNRRDVLVHVPRSLDRRRQRRYPVVYAHDGQNLFDEVTSNSGEWRFDETMEQLEGEGLAAIVVGIPNTTEGRASEYSPWRNRQYGGGRGKAHLRFVTGTVKPLVDALFPTRPEREATGILGSSLGGLMSMYAFFARPDVFGFAGVLSPAFWWSERSFAHVEREPYVPGRLWLDVGGSEDPGNPRRNAAYVNGLRRMVALLEAKGYGARELRWVVEPEARHHEDEWARRLPDALRFLLSGVPARGAGT